MSVATELSPEVRERIRKEAQEVRDRVLTGQPKPKRVRAPKQPYQGPTGKKRGENLANRPPKYDRTQIQNLYAAGCTVKEISSITGAHRATVAAALNEVGIDPKERKGGPTPKEKCGAGLHDMEVHGRPVKGGGRYCAVCKSERGKKAWARKKN